MKKYLFFASAVFAGLSLKAQFFLNPSDNDVYVSANTNVKVAPSTLFYVNGGITLAKYTANKQKFSNEGNVKIKGDFANNNLDGSNFVNEASSKQYGQLIIEDSKNVTGNVTSKIKLNQNFVYHSLAVPYKSITAKDLVKQVYTGKSDSEIERSFVGYNGTYKGKNYFDPNRIKNSLFVWDNSKYYLKNLAKDDVIDPTSYYALNKGSVLDAFNTDEYTSLSGIPNNATKLITINSYSIEKNRDVNPVGEYYGAYIIDYTTPVPADWENYKQDVTADGFGSNIFNFGNPYTSNIDLSKLGSDFIQKVKVLVQYESQTYDKAINEGNASGSSNSGSTFLAYSPNEGTGDMMKYVRPWQTFSAKMNKDNFTSASFTFNDNVKTFDVTSDAPNILYNRKVDVQGGINQLGLDLYDSEGNNTGSRVYVIASKIYEASQKGKGTEVYNVSIKDNDTAIYTLQEAENGLVDENLAKNKTYINGVNADKYIAKPIHMVFQNGKGRYTLKARLNDDLLNNKNKFYFEDKVKGKVLEVTKNFEYSFDINGTDNNRFVLYWAEKPVEINNKEIAKEENLNKTIIFKKDQDYVVRFANTSNNRRAKVFVYNISGQLVSVQDSVDTSRDYLIPIKGNSSVYIIKVIDGENVITKKIIK